MGENRRYKPNAGYWVNVEHLAEYKANYDLALELEGVELSESYSPYNCLIDHIIANDELFKCNDEVYKYIDSINFNHFVDKYNPDIIE